jgi:hypothetical protein
MRLICLFPLLLSALFYLPGSLADPGARSTSDTIFPVKQITPNSLLYSGTEYAKVYTSASGHPFFMDRAVKGWVDYYNNRYENIPIFYDIENDWVVYNEPVNQIRICLVNEKIDGFMIEGHRFISLKDTTGFLGFYELLYQGRRKVLMKWSKILTRSGADEGKYIMYSNIYIQEGSNLEQVSSRKELVSYFGNNKKKMQQYYQDQHLNVKKDPARAVSSMVAFAEQNGY